MDGGGGYAQLILTLGLGLVLSQWRPDAVRFDADRRC